MSKDDGNSSVSRLYDDGYPDEDDQVCERLFSEGLGRLCPQLSNDSGNVTTSAIPSTTPDIARDEVDLVFNDEVPTVSGATQQAPPVSRVPLSSLPAATVEAADDAELQTTNAAITITTEPENNESGNALVATDRGLSNQRLPTSASPRGSCYAPGLPPRPTSSPRTISRSPSIDVSACEQPSSSRQSSGEKRKRSSLLVSSYYITVWVPKQGNAVTMIQKRMCRRCKTVVQSKSQNVLVHTANCRFTPLMSKKNALDQSRNREIPEVSLDSREGEQRDILDHAKKEDRGREARDAVLAKRALSATGLERDSKRRKTDSTVRRSTSRECGPKDCDRLHLALTRAIVWHNLPFSICDRHNSYDTPFLEMLQEFKPDYPRCCKPNSDRFRNTYLTLYYNEMRQRVLRCLNLSLSSTYAYGTVMFDGWEDINGNAVVNVMLRVTSSLVSGTATYFLDSVYTKDKKVDAEKYVKIIESVMASFQGQRQSPFTGINGAVSDSARACVKAKGLLATNHVGMVTIQDQAHAADLLMSDLGKIPWLDEVLSKVNTIVQALRSNRKLLSRFRDLIDDFNRELKKKNESSGKRVIPRAPAADMWSLLHTWELDELENEFIVRDAEGESNTTRESHRVESRPRGSQRTAVTIKKTVKTRFASAETMLEGYLRSRDVLKLLTRDPEFDRLYDASRVANREKRDKHFVEVIDDDGFYTHVVDVHKILRVIRRYLRVRDAENAQISEVVPATLLLDFSLNRVGNTPFLTPERKREVLEALKKRCRGKTTNEGGTMQIRILQDVHYTAWLLDPNLCPVIIDEFLPAFERHARVYLSGVKTGLDELQIQRASKSLTKAYREVHKLWDTMRKGTRNSGILDTYAGHALRYWEDETPADTVLKDDPSGVATDLQCFARYTLSICPSSCATERSFSHQGRIHTKQRSRLKPDVVQKLLFCKWNARVLRNLDRIEFDKNTDKETLKLGSIHPYEDFLSKPAITSVFSDRESAELRKRILSREQRTQEQIRSARNMLYKNSQVYIYAGVRQDSFAASFGTQIPLETSQAHSAQTSVQDKSTTVTGELSRKPRSQSRTEQRLTYHAKTTEQLAELLSASKDTSAWRDRSTRAEPIPFNIELQEDGTTAGVTGTGTADVEKTLQDEDSITMSVATARQMLLNRQSIQKNTPTDPPQVHRAGDHNADEVQLENVAVEGRVTNAEQPFSSPLEQGTEGAQIMPFEAAFRRASERRSR